MACNDIKASVYNRVCRVRIDVAKGLGPFIARVNEGFEDGRFSYEEINTYTSGILSLMRLYSVDGIAEP